MEKNTKDQKREKCMVIETANMKEKLQANIATTNFFRDAAFFYFGMKMQWAKKFFITIGKVTMCYQFHGG